jgi:hypothetical protein
VFCEQTTAQRGYATTAEAAEGISDPADELPARCRAYCHFAFEHPNLYQVMFQADLPLTTLAGGPAATPGRRSFENLVATVNRCRQSGLAPRHDDPFRLASLIWAAELQNHDCLRTVYEIAAADRRGPLLSSLRFGSTSGSGGHSRTEADIAPSLVMKSAVRIRASTLRLYRICR